MEAEIHTCQRYNDKLSHCGFVYSRERAKGGSTYWLCQNRQTCGGRAVSVMKDGILQVRINRGHSHPPNADEVTVLRVKSNIQRKAVEQSHLSATELVSQELECLSAADRLVLPGFDSLCRLVSKSRMSLRRHEPGNVADLQIPENYCKTSSGHQFLLHDNIIRNEVDQTTQRTIVFATDDNLRNLFASSVWFADSTFQIAPTKFFQLWTIQGQVNEIVVPLVYVLMQTKREEEYMEALQRIRQRAAELEIFDQMPYRIMVDLSRGALISLRNMFPQSQICMSLFNYKQAMLRKLKDFCLTAEYGQGDSLVKQLHASVIGLAYVPPSDVIEAFELLTDILGSEDQTVPRLKRLLEHLDQNYVRGRPETVKSYLQPQRYPIEMWNIFERTLTDDVNAEYSTEDWHRIFNLIVRRGRFSMFALLSAIRREQDCTEGTLSAKSVDERCGPATPEELRKKEDLRNHVMRYQEFKDARKVLEYIRIAGSYHLLPAK